MSDDFTLFKTEDRGEPPDGDHTAWLERTAVLDTKNGTRIKCEWRTTDMAFYWESWHGVSGAAKAHTQKLLTGIGIDLAKIGSWDQLGDELAVLENTMYDVTVSRRGDFVNTAVAGKSQGIQADLPIETSGLPERGAAPAAARATAGMFGDDDDDIPF